MQFERTFKVVMLGDFAVGKTSLVARLLKREFTPEYYPTIGTNISEKRFDFPNYSAKLAIWDSSGQRKFDEVKREYFGNAKAAILVYDICRPDSFEHIDDWYTGMMSLTDRKPPTHLVGNKMDLAEKRQVNREEAGKISKKFGFSYVETSAKTGENVDALFNSLLADLIRERLEGIKQELGGKKL